MKKKTTVLLKACQPTELSIDCANVEGAERIHELDLMTTTASLSADIYQVGSQEPSNH